jgi:hypothetical protein
LGSGCRPLVAILMRHLTIARQRSSNAGTGRVFRHTHYC